MKLKDIKFEREEDLDVLKIILRCLKEENSLYCNERKEHSLKDIINKCYRSRHNHTDENFQTNFFYWPYDESIFNCHLTRLLYESMLISKEWYTCKTHNKRFIESFTHELIGNFNLYHKFKGDLTGYLDIMKKALTKCGMSEKMAAEKCKIVSLLSNAYNYSIPF